MPRFTAPRRLYAGHPLYPAVVARTEERKILISQALRSVGHQRLRKWPTSASWSCDPTVHVNANMKHSVSLKPTFRCARFQGTSRLSIFPHAWTNGWPTGRSRRVHDLVCHGRGYWSLGWPTTGLLFLDETLRARYFWKSRGITVIPFLFLFPRFYSLNAGIVLGPEYSELYSDVSLE